MSDPTFNEIMASLTRIETGLDKQALNFLQLQAQRDALLEACKEALAFGEYRATPILRAAIAKAEGKPA